MPRRELRNIKRLNNSWNREFEITSDGFIKEGVAQHKSLFSTRVSMARRITAARELLQLQMVIKVMSCFATRDSTVVWLRPPHFFSTKLGARVAI